MSAHCWIKLDLSINIGNKALLVFFVNKIIRLARLQILHATFTHNRPDTNLRKRKLHRISQQNVLIFS